MGQQIALINGQNYSWADISLVLFGLPVVGITKISYKEKMKKENNYGSGQYPISRGYGNVEPDASLELYTDVWKEIIAASPNRNPLLIPPFDIQVVYSANGSLKADKDVLRQCEFLDNPFEAKQGDTKLLIAIPLIIGMIER